MYFLSYASKTTSHELIFLFISKFDNICYNICHLKMNNELWDIYR